MPPHDRDRGDYIVTITAADNGDGGGAIAVLRASSTFVVKVASAAEPPQLAPVGPKVAVIDQQLQFVVRASDLDQDALQFTAQNLPSGASFVPGVGYGTAVFAWTPTAADAGTRSVTFTVTDSTGGSDSRTIDLVVRATNSAPVLLPVGNRTVAETTLLDLQLAALDADGDVLSWSATGLPPGAQLDSATGRLRWQTNYFSAGTYPGITLTVSDGAASSTETIAITVTQTDQAPRFSIQPPVQTQESQLLQFTLFTDAGEVWNRGPAQVKSVKLKVTPGIQVTAFSPVGPVRIAVGYNPYQRPRGPLYHEATDEGGALLCVSPFNFIPTHFTYDQTGKIISIKQDVSAVGCPSSYQPAKDNRFRSKLTFSFAIGQAF